MSNSNNMNKIVLSFVFLFAGAIAKSQVSGVTWSEEMKFNKGSMEFRVIGSDKTGFFLQESHPVVKSYFVIGYSVRDVAKLIRMDKNMVEQYNNDFAKELKGKEFDRFLFIKDKLFIIADDYNKKELQLMIYFAEVDKATGTLKGDWKLMETLYAEDKNKAIQYKFDYTGDSSKVVFINTLLGKETNAYNISILGPDLSPVTKYPPITNEFDPKTYVLEDVLVAPAGQVLLLGRENEYVEGKKKKDKFLQFRNYNTRIYGTNGKLIKEIKTDSEKKWLVNSKALINNNEIVMAAFYSDERKKKEINGLVVMRIDPATGNLVSDQTMELNKGMISIVEEDEDDDEKKSKKKDDDDDEEGLSGDLVFRKFVIAPDNSFVFFAEKVSSRLVSYTTYNGTGASRSAMTTSYIHYECGDIYTAKIDVSGKINWFYTFPKFQRERIPAGVSAGTLPSYTAAYFLRRMDKPYYAGFGVANAGGKSFLFFNDNPKNAGVTKAGQKIKTLNYNFDKSDCFTVEVNLLTGEMKRRVAFSNNDIPNAMPRLGNQLGNTFYFIGKTDKTFGKAKVVVGKCTVK